MTWFARNVTTRLSWLGLTRADLAEALDVGPASMSGTLQAARPRKASVARIAAALGLDPTDLLAEEATGKLLEPHPGMALSDPTEAKVAAMRARLPARQDVGRRSFAKESRSGDPS